MLDRSIVLSEAGLDISHPIEKSDIGGFLLIVDLDGHPIEVEGLLPLFPQFVVTGLLFKFFDFHGLRTGNGFAQTRTRPNLSSGAREEAGETKNAQTLGPRMDVRSSSINPSAAR